MALNFDLMTTRVNACGEYVVVVENVEEVETKKGSKIVARVIPIDEDGNPHETETIWFDKVAKARERSFWEALGCPDDLEDCIGMRVGANITLNEKDGNTYVNMNSFFVVEQEEEFMEVDADDIPFE